MARTTRSKAAVATAPDAVKAEATPSNVTKSAATTNSTAIKSENKEPKDDSKPKGRERRSLRRKLYKKAKRHHAAEELHKTLLESAGSSKPLGKAERAALRAQVYQPHRIRVKKATKRVTELERLVRKQQEEIRELRKLATGSGIPKLQPPAGTPPPPADDAEPDSSPAKIRDQLFADAAQSGGTTVVEVEEVIKRPAGGEPMEGVQETHVVTSVEQDVEYPALPSVEDTAQVTAEAGDKQEKQHEATKEAAAPNPPALKLTPADTPIKSKEEVRHSSAEDSNAGTPRNVRRSPRKRAPKRRSFSGHSYVG